MFNTAQFYATDTLNIFTDASVSGNYTGYGAIALGNIKVIDNNPDSIITKIAADVEPGTNNLGEIKAIRLGVLLALELKRTHNINRVHLFSDSKISIMGLRNWCLNWMKYYKDGVLYKNSSYTETVANQEVFLSIIKTIIENNLNIDLYHCRGHINYKNSTMMQNALNSFYESNGFYITNQVLVSIVCANDAIDNYTRLELTDTLSKVNRDGGTIRPINKLYTNTGYDYNMELYKKLIGNSRKRIPNNYFQRR